MGSPYVIRDLIFHLKSKHGDEHPAGMTAASYADDKVLRESLDALGWEITSIEEVFV